MAFWGVEVKPGKPYIHAASKNSKGRLHVSQATLGMISSSMSKGTVLLQCNVGDKSPVYLCRLSLESLISCAVNVQFEEEEDVIFSVIGPCSIHLVGYYMHSSRGNDRENESESFGEDINDTESENSVHGSDEDNYEDSFIDDDEPKVYESSSLSSDGGNKVNTDADKNKVTNGSRKKLKKKNSNTRSNVVQPRQKLSNRGFRAVLSDDESDDNLIISSTEEENKVVSTSCMHLESSKRDSSQLLQTVCDSFGASKPKKKKHINSKVEKSHLVSLGNSKTMNNKKEKPTNKKRNDMIFENVYSDAREKSQVALKIPTDIETDNQFEDSHTYAGSNDKREKKKKIKRKYDELRVDKAADVNFHPEKYIKEDKVDFSTLNNQNDAGTSKLECIPCSVSKCNDEQEKSGIQSETYSNGLKVEVLEIGNPGSQPAVAGKKVTIKYTGFFKDSGNMFDFSVNGSPKKFRLGKGKVIKGLDMGIAGMLVGEKRRVTIPPALGYGKEGNGDAVPPNTWLMYEVQLLNVR